VGEQQRALAGLVEANRATFEEAARLRREAKRIRDERPPRREETVRHH
jgi:hypothetical protein